jgi:hypothetical protein
LDTLSSPIRLRPEGIVKPPRERQPKGSGWPHDGRPSLERTGNVVSPKFVEEPADQVFVNCRLHVNYRRYEPVKT